MIEQIKTVNNLDLLLLLGSGKSITDRCEHTYFLQENVKNREYLDMVLSGKGRNHVTEAESMKSYLTFLGIPEKHCYLEEQSLDTLGNMVFSQPIISQILSGQASKNIGLVTDSNHMMRSNSLAKKVFGTKYEIFPLPTPKLFNPRAQLFEYLALTVTQLDLWVNRVETGNQEMFEEYIKGHPLYYSNNKGTKKQIIRVLNNIRS